MLKFDQFISVFALFLAIYFKTNQVKASLAQKVKN